MAGHKLPSSIGTAGKPKPKPRPKAIDKETHQVLALLLARSIAHANVKHHARADEAASRLVHVLRAHGINPT